MRTSIRKKNKEIEELNIETVDLLLGIALRASNVSENHYEGSAARLGRALSESKDREQLEGIILEMIRDDDLDPFNRLLMAYLYDNYYYHLDSAEQGTKYVAFEAAMQTFPDHLLEVWEQE